VYLSSGREHPLPRETRAWCVVSITTRARCSNGSRPILERAKARWCAGGRYDGLVEILGRQSTPAAGFALRLERFGRAGRVANRWRVATGRRRCMLRPLGEGMIAQQGLVLAEQLRDAGLRVELHCGGGSLKSQLKRADRSGARATRCFSVRASWPAAQCGVSKTCVPMSRNSWSA